MEVFDAVRTLLAVRSYKQQPIPAVVVRQIVEAGRLTGSGMNRQPWHFIVVQSAETLAELGKLARTGPYIAQAPMAIMVLVDRTPLATSDASRAIQSMLLTAWAAGVGSNWVGFNNLNDTRPLLNIPDTYDVFAALAFGYPAEARGQGKKQRRAFDEVVSSERFGELLG